MLVLAKPVWDFVYQYAQCSSRVRQARMSRLCRVLKFSLKIWLCFRTPCLAMRRDYVCRFGDARKIYNFVFWYIGLHCRNLHNLVAVELFLHSHLCNNNLEDTMGVRIIGIQTRGLESTPLFLISTPRSPSTHCSGHESPLRDLPLARIYLISIPENSNASQV